MVSWSFVNENLRSRGRVVGERDVTLSTARRELSFKRSMITRCAGSDRVWGLVSGGEESSIEDRRRCSERWVFLG